MPPYLALLSTLIGSNYLSRTNFHGPKGVRAIEVPLYMPDKHIVLFQSGPSCAKLTMSIVNISLKFQTLISSIC